LSIVLFGLFFGFCFAFVIDLLEVGLDGVSVLGGVSS